MSDAQREDSPSVLNELREEHAILDRLGSWYHVPALLAMLLVMLRIRLTGYDQFIRDGTVYFSGNDAWYHLREVNYTIRHWPQTMPFDPWTGFPVGVSAGQFGTIYDQIVATAALLVGLGSPSSELVAKTLLVAPAVFGALTVIPTYLIGKRLGGRLAGLFGAAILMLLPGVFLRRGLVGFADHNIAEPFFQAFAVLGLMVALSVADDEKPVWELVAAREWDALRRPLLWAALAGVATGLYIWSWPPGVLLVGIFGTYLVVKLTSDYVNGRSPEPVAFVGGVAMGVTALMAFISMSELTFGVTDFSLLQPLLALAVAGGSVFLAGLARVWDDNDIDARGYPVVVFGLIVVALGVVAVALPDLWSTIQRNVLRTIGFSAGAETRTIGEAQPFLSPSVLSQQATTPVGRILSEYGFTLFTAVAAAIWLVAQPLVDTEESGDIAYALGALAVVVLLYLVPAIPAALGGVVGVDPALVGVALVGAILVGATLRTGYDSEKLFVLVWAAFITAAAFTQVRFNYYLAVTVAVMNAYLIGHILSYLDLDRLSSVTDLKGYQVLAVAAVVMLVLAPVLVVPLNVRNTGSPQFDSSQTAWQAASGNSPGSIVQWDDSLQWMADNTPAEGDLGNANNEMEYYGTYEQTDDFDYPEGAYGVQSWWDYGHWITVRGERIPNANPFQQNAKEAANFLLAPNETQAEDVLTGQSTEGNQTRYVVVDWQMASPNSKFGAPIVWYDQSNVTQSDFYHPVYSQQFNQRFLQRNQRYYESLMVRLYEYHGSSAEPQPIVVDWDVRQVQTGGGNTVTVRTAPAGNESLVKRFDNMSAARQYVERDGSSQVGGVGATPVERVPALEHYRLVKTSNASALQSRTYSQSLLSTSRMTGIAPNALVQTQPTWVKTFERVPGATVEGSGAPANSTVTAEVDMYNPVTNSTFTYTQKAQANANGEFAMTLPYSTTGYDAYGPENGYTNVSVRANSSYTIYSPTQVERKNNSTVLTRNQAKVDIDEGLVNGAKDETKTVTLEEKSTELKLGGGDDGGNSSDSGSGSSGGGSNTANTSNSLTEPTLSADRTQANAPA